MYILPWHYSFKYKSYFPLAPGKVDTKYREVTPFLGGNGETNPSIRQGGLSTMEGGKGTVFF